MTDQTFVSLDTTRSDESRNLEEERLDVVNEEEQLEIPREIKHNYLENNSELLSQSDDLEEMEDDNEIQVQVVRSPES